MATFFNPMPLDGAHFVENPAKVFVGRVARAVQYDKQLYDAYKNGTFFDSEANLRKAIEASLRFRGNEGKLIREAKAMAAKELGGRSGDKKAKFEARVNELLQGKVDRSALAGKKASKPLSDGFREALAVAMGRGVGFQKATERNRARYLEVYSKVTGKGLARRSGELMLGKNYRSYGIPKDKGSKSTRGIVLGSTFRGQLKAAPTPDYFKREGLRAFGSGSASADKAALLEEMRGFTEKDARGRVITQWWDVPGKQEEYDRRLAEIKGAHKTAFGASPRGTKKARPTEDQIVNAIMTRFKDAATLRAEGAYAPLLSKEGRLLSSYPARSAAGGSQASDAAKKRNIRARVKATGEIVTVSEKELQRRSKTLERVANNPFGDLGYDSLALSNPTGIGIIDSVESAVDGVPVVGPVIAPIVAPAALGAAAAAVHILVVPRLEQYLPSWAQAYSYSIGGAAVGIVSGFVASRASDSTTRTAAGLIGGAAVAIGLGIDAYRMFVAKGGATAGDDMGSLALSGDELGDDMGSLALSGDDMGSLALSGLGESALGDGGAFQIQNLGYAGDHNALSSMYSDASMADAYFSGPDLDGMEGEAALAGASTFMGTFGAAPIRAAGQKRVQSRHAGLRGHRWGWMIKLVGFENFQKIVALSPEQRVSVIKQLREQAMASVQRFVDESKAAQLASKPVTAPDALSAQGATAGYDLSGYGATLFSGNGY